MLKATVKKMRMEIANQIKDENENSTVYMCACQIAEIVGNDEAEAVREERKIAKEKFDKEKQSIAESNRKYTLKAAEEAVIKAKEEWQSEQIKKQSELEIAISEAQSRAAALEKELELKGDDKTVRFSIMFEQIQTDLISCINLIDEISAEDAEKAQKYKAALHKACELALVGE